MFNVSEKSSKLCDLPTAYAVCPGLIWKSTPERATSLSMVAAYFQTACQLSMVFGVIPTHFEKQIWLIGTHILQEHAVVIPDTCLDMCRKCELQQTSSTLLAPKCWCSKVRTWHGKVCPFSFQQLSKHRTGLHDFRHVHCYRYGSVVKGCLVQLRWRSNSGSALDLSNCRPRRFVR